MNIPQKNIRKITPWVTPAVLVVTLVATLILYWPAAGFGWITGLDQEFLIDNKLVHRLTADNIIEIFFSSTAGRYTPLAFLAFSLDLAILPGNPVGMVHIMNIVLHLINVVLLFRLLQMISRSRAVPLIASIIFALHPLNLESVAWISSRSILLVSFCMLAGLLFFEYSRHSEKRGLRLLGTLCYLAALFTHISAVFFPLMLVLSDKKNGSSWRDAFTSRIPFLGLALIFVLIGVLSGELLNVNNISALFNSIEEPGLLLRQFLVPVGISGLQDRFMPDIFFAAYLPVMVLSVFIAWGISALAKGRIRTFLASLLFAAWLSWIVVVSFTRINDWENSEKYWNRIITLNPQSSRAYFHRGDHRAMRKDFNRAKFDYTQSIKMDPTAYMAMNNLGLIYLGENDLPFAIIEFENAISVKEDFYKPHLNLGLAYMRMGKNELAMLKMTQAIALNPSASLSYYNRGLIYERDDLLDEAIGDFTIAIDLDPYMYLYYKDRGKALVWKRRYAEAEQDFSKALDLDDSDPEMWFRRSLARVSQDKFKEGLEDAFVARSLGMDISEDYIKGLTRQILEADSVLMK